MYEQEKPCEQTKRITIGEVLKDISPEAYQNRDIAFRIMCFLTGPRPSDDQTEAPKSMQEAVCEIARVVDETNRLLREIAEVIGA